MRKTGFVCDESYFWHNTGNGALFVPTGGWVESDILSENPAAKRRFRNLLDRSGLLAQLTSITPRPATREEVERCHSPEYINKVKTLSNTTTGGDAGESAIVGSGSYEIALLAAGGAITAVDAVMTKQIQNAYALTRPPGHHAEKDRGMGWCIFNNVAIAAKYAKETYNLKKILILDWDVHHGNGIESAFYDDPDVLFISLHQELNYPPDRGLMEHVGNGRGEGFNVNIPLPAGTGNAGYMYAFEQVVRPIVDEFQPELILVSAGQDASIFDPHARMMVTAEGFRKFTTFILQLAERHCEGRLVACHEGGYSAAYTPFCSLAIVEEMSGIRTEVTDPFVFGVASIPTEELYAIQKEYVEAVRQIQSRYWNL